MSSFHLLSIFILWTFNIAQAANNLRNELPVVRLYEIRTSTPNKLEGSGTTEQVLDRPPNSNIIVGEDIQPSSKLVMECDARYPVQWVYLGDGMPEYSTNTTQTQNSGGITRPDNLFSASLSLGFRRPISSHDSGKYTCRGLQNPDLSVFYFLYASEGDRLFVNPVGEIIYYKQSDPTVRIPCGVSNPKSTVSLQKSINGLVQCPLNESINYDSTKGFELKVSNYFNPSGTYICTAGLNGTYQVVSYTVVKDVDTTVTTDAPVKGNCVRNSDCQSSQACIQQGRNGNSCVSPCGSVCGRNTQCDVTNHVPSCNCLPGHSGDPYKACYANSKPEHFEKDPCFPSPCGINTICERHGGIARCECASGFHGDPYSRCHYIQEKRDPCNPNPCGANSVCNHRNSFTSCSCSPGYYGRPPYCRPECETNSHCPSDRACVHGRCRNPCEGACSTFHRTECRVINRQPVCATISCSPGYYGRDCLSIYTKEDGQIIIPERLGEQRTPSVEQVTPCIPYPCGKDAECVVKTVKNSVLNKTTELALCQCPPGKTGNADVECYPIAEQRILKIEEVSESVNVTDNNNTVTQNSTSKCVPECGINANCLKNTCVCPKNTQGYPLIKCYPIFCTSVEDCDNVNASCVAGKCAELGSTAVAESTNINKKCGENSIEINANGKVTCACPSNWTGTPTVACHPIIPEISTTINQTPSTSTLTPILNPDICEQCGKHAKCVFQTLENTTTCECIKPFVGSPLIGCELNCTQNSDCPSDHLCHNISRKCVDPCEHRLFFVECGRNAECKVENHIPVCYCPKDFPHGSPQTHCKEEGWMPTHHGPNATCEDAKRLNCGPNAVCKRFHDIERCVCIPGHYGSPTDSQGCKPGLQCRKNFQCSTDEECMNGKCLNVCRNRNSCGPLAGCRVVENHKASCICHIGTIKTPSGECQAAKGAIAERLLFYRSVEEV